MSFADWAINGTLSGVVVEPPTYPIEVTYPAVGLFNPDDWRDGSGNLVDFAVDETQCLVLAGDGPSALRWGAAVNTAPAYQGTRGRLLAAVRMNTLYNGPANMGIAVLLSQEDLTPGNGAQGYVLSIDTLFFDPRVRLMQMTDGVGGPPDSSFGTSYTLLADSDDNAFLLGEVVGIELRWESDPAVLKGVRLQAYYELVDMPRTLLWDIVYTGADAYKPTESVGCAIVCGLGSNNVITYCDNITVYNDDAET